MPNISQPLPTFVLSDHACRFCGGRILNGSSNQANQFALNISSSQQSFICSSCERNCTGKLSPREICYCGYLDENNRTSFVCLKKTNMISANILQAAKLSGFKVNSDLRVGFINLELFQEARKKDNSKSK